MPYPNEHACRVHDPGGYKRLRRQNGKGKKPDMIFGVKADGKTEVQAFRFPTSRFSAAEAKEFCSKSKGRFEKASGQKEAEEIMAAVMKEWLADEGEGKELFLESGNLTEAKIDEREDGLFLRDVALLGATSKNRVRYHEAMEDAVSRGLYEGVRMYFSHKDGPRDVRDMFGKTVNSRFVKEEMKIRSDVLVRDVFKEEIKSLVKGFADVCGFSHVADCRWRKADDNWKNVKHITEVLNIDMVDRPGTNKSMYEDDSNFTEGGAREMTLEELKTENPELFSEMEKEIREKLNTDKALETMKAQLAERDEKIKAYEDKEKERAKEDRIRESEKVFEKVLGESELTDKLKGYLKESVKGRVFENEEQAKNAITEVQKIAQLAMADVKPGHIPETKDSGDGKGEPAKFAEGLIGKILCREEPKKEEKKKE